MKDRNRTKKFKKEGGITLIALIITIIILVILAAVSIRAIYNMGIVGHAINGTQQYAERAKEENAMFGNLGSFIDNAVSKIKETQGDNKIITPSSQNGAITLSYTSGGTTEDGKVILRVIPTLESSDSIPTYEEYCEQRLVTVTTDNDLKAIILEYFNSQPEELQYLVENGFLEEGKSATWQTMEKMMKEQGATGEITAQMMLEADSIDKAKENCVKFGLLEIGYVQQYGKEITITCNGEDKKTNSLYENSYVEFEIANGGEYEILADTLDGSNGKTIAYIIIISPIVSTIYPYETVELSTDVNYEKLVWESSNFSVATVDNGIVTGVSSGNTKITINSSEYDVISNECSITVYNISTYVNAINLNTNDLVIGIGENNQLLTNVTPSYATRKVLKWTSDDSSIATVDENGNIQGIGVGKTIIRVKTMDGSNIEEICEVNVLPIGEYINYDCYTGVSAEKLTCNISSELLGTESSIQYILDEEMSRGLKWILLGKNGENLLLTTVDPVFTNNKLTMSENYAYGNSETVLNQICAIFGNNQYAEGARSITVYDLNNIHGKQSSGSSYYRYALLKNGSSIASLYYKVGEGNWQQKASSYHFTYFKYLDGANWISLTDSGESSPKIYMESYNYELNSDGVAGKLKYKDGTTSYEDVYWLATNGRLPLQEDIWYYVHTVENGSVQRKNVDNVTSNGMSPNVSAAIRPVVVLKSNIGIKKDSNNQWILYEKSN